jgi:uncharacterized protein Yka (UPF0111/DUF47 family)
LTNGIVFLLFILLLVSSIITFVSRRQLATSNNELAKAKSDIVQWKQKIEKCAGNSTNETKHDELIEETKGLKQKAEQEIDRLISPLYAKLTKNDEIIDFMTTYKISRIDKYSDSQRPNGNAQGKELEKLEEEIKEIMLQYGHLAPDYLYNLIKKFKELEPDWEPEQPKRFEANKVLREIQKITGERQEELRVKLKECAL